MTTQHHSDIHENQTDIRPLANLIIELNIARRNSRAYPKGHPVIAASLQKAIGIYNQLFNRVNKIVITIAHDTLMVDDIVIDKSNQIFRDLARTLFERGIGALVMTPGLTADELNNFTIILGLKRDDITRHGGIEQVWSKARITAISIIPVRYDVFSTTEEATITGGAHGKEGLWEQFARSLARGGGSNAGLPVGIHNDPVQMAAMLNSTFTERSSLPGAANEYAVAIADIMHGIDAESSSFQTDDISFQRLAAFVSNLNPELRRQFLETTFKRCEDGISPSVEKMVSQLSNDAILDTLSDVNTSRMKIPPVIMGLIQRLGQHSAPPHHAAADELQNIEQDELGSKMKTLFREQAAEEFVPDVYQRKLDHLMTLNEIPNLGRDELLDLHETLEPRNVEERISEIILQLLAMDAEADSEALLGNLGDMCSYFLETGDYEQVMKIMTRSRDTNISPVFRSIIRQHLSRREFLDEVLSGLHIWGKSRYEQIREIIVDVGEPFIDALLDSLAEENNMSLRRFLMDRLLEFGPTARQPILDRLSDKRWFVLRNLIIMLRSMNDITVLDPLKPMLRHENVRVRQEAIRVFLDFNDPLVERQILHDLSSKDKTVQLAAIHLADKSHSPDVYKGLITILQQTGLSTDDYEIKAAAILSLGEIGRPEALPELAKILSAKSLFHAKVLAKLKLDVIRSLEYYRTPLATQMLETLAKGKDELARQAATTLRSTLAKKHD